MMRYNRLGRTGLKISEVSLGTMAFGRWIDQDASAQVLDSALDHGINLIDTADVYGKGMDVNDPLQHGDSEIILGHLLKGRRDKVLVATKAHARVGLGVNDAGQSRYHLIRAVENSLKRLQTDYIDLFQVHRFDPATPLEETLRTLDDLVRAGKIRYIGCSNFAAWQLAKAQGVSELRGLHRFESVQPEYSLISREIEAELLPFARSENTGVIVYSPLGRGILTGKYSDAQAQPPEGSRLAAGEARLKLLLNKNPGLALVDAIRPLAEQRGWTLAQFALVWVLGRSGVTSAILGSSKREQVEASLKHIEQRLTSEELEVIDSASRELGIIR